VVATQHKEVLRVLDLVGQHQTDRLDGLLPSIHVVPQEEIVTLAGETRVLEQFYEVRVLSVNVA
jgi:hypothetical protein